VRERGVWRGTVTRRRRDGSRFPASCTVVGLRNAAGSITHFVGVERDTTEELKLRDQLVHSERLSAIGELVAGVAHEINNPLQTIVGSVELMMEEGPSAAARRDLDLVRREASRAGQIVRNLLSFVRRSAPDRGMVDLNDVIRAMVQLREFHLQQNNITLVMELHPGELRTLANRDEMQQVILNLMLNAEQAIELSGTGDCITVRSYAAGQHQMIEIMDNGPGVGADLSGRIFEPFFTTKEVGQGTGLGLSISHGIAAAHGGSLELCHASAGQRGACFRLTLPAHHEPARSSPLPASGIQRRMHPRALVVDDEATIRKLLGRLLARRGFDIVEAESGDTAVAVASREALTVVLCDMQMPGMHGGEIYRRLTSIDPNLARNFVFITGDKSKVVVDEGLRHVPVLEKPFTAADLHAMLESIGINAAVA
jgi:two-component system NtrC family sensor kinase